MKKQEKILLTTVFGSILLEIIPFGAVCNFAVSPEAGGGSRRTLFSYFSLIPYGYANFGPFITAVLTCVIALLLIFALLFRKKCGHYRAIGILSGIAFLTSLLPLLFGLSNYSVVGLLISLLLGVSGVLCFWIEKERKRMIF